MSSSAAHRELVAAGPAALPSVPSADSQPATAGASGVEPTTSSRDVVIAVSDLGKCYEIYARPIDRLKQTLYRGRRQFYREFWALRGVSFEVQRGETVGIIGRNGSGKSTLLQIIAGTLRPSEGQVVVRGRVSALLELGSGFNPEFTGRENVFLNGSILGLPHREIEERFDEIAAFADIGEFIDMPVKTYSTGMVLRLGFAVQAQLSPDVLIVDEALAVGDALFQKRCFQKIEELRSSGVTLILVSHEQEIIRTLTDKALLLHEGRVRACGSPAEVVLEYRRLLHAEEQRWFSTLIERHVASPEPPAAENREQRITAIDRRSFGDLDAEILAVQVLDAAGEPCTVFYPWDRLTIRVTVQVHVAMRHLNVGVRLRNKEGVKIYSWGTLNQDISIWSGRRSGQVFWERLFQAGETIQVDFVCEARLGTNLYEVQAAVSEEEDRFYSAQRILHWKDEAAFFQVLVPKHEHFFGGVVDLRMTAHVRD